MAKNITKNLKLKAILEDQKLKKQLQELKKELGGFEIGGSTLRDFDKSTKMLNEAANSLKQAMQELKRGSAAIGSGGGVRKSPTNSQQQSERKREIREIVSEVTKNSSGKSQSYFDPTRGRYVNLGKGEVYDQEMGKKFKKEMHHEAAKFQFREKEEEKQRKKSEQAAKKRLKEEAKAKELERRKDVNAAKDFITAIGSRTGMGLPMARQMSQSIGSIAPGAVGAAGKALRGVGAFLGTGTGMALSGAAGLAAAPLLIGGIGNSYLNQTRQMRSMRAQHENMGTIQMLQGQGLQGLLEDAARKQGSTGFSGFAGGVSQFADDLISFSPARWGRSISSFWGAENSSYNQGKIQAGASEAEAVQEEQRLANSALGLSKNLRGIRLSNMRGGIGGETINALQQLGVEEGFGLEETNRQLAAAKSVMGSYGATHLPLMQQMLQRTGTSIEDQAIAADTLTGAKRGASYAESMMKNVEILKRGVAAGLDFSKSGKFLKTTADFVQSSMGLGEVNIDAIAKRLSDTASGFAGGGPVTEANLRQAQTLQGQITSESTSMSSFAGIGNIMGIQEALGPNMSPEQFLAASSLSSNATLEDAMKITGGDKEAAKRLLEAKTGNLGRGLSAVTDNELLQGYFGAQATGQNFEQFQGRLKAQQGKAGDFNQSNLDQGRPLGKELDSSVVEFRTQQKAFVSGMEIMATETSRVNNNLNEFSKKLQDAVDRLQDYTKVLDNER